MPENPAATTYDSPFHPNLARASTGVLATFNAAGVLGAADVHVATHLGQLLKETDPGVLLALALTVRAVGAGSVCLDLSGLPTGPGDPRTQDWDIDPSGWPAIADWRGLLAGSALFAPANPPVHLDGPRLYLDRYWREESQVLADLVTRTSQHAPVDEAVLGASLEAYFPDPAYADQRAAAELVARTTTTVLTGGPGTGKTTTVARLLGVLLDADPTLRVALAAPTGKAAARMGEAVREATGHPEFPARHTGKIAALPSMTIHRLLGYRPGNRFVHHRGNPLPFDVVIVDETSMVALSLMASLLGGLRTGARLVLVGDADQLASVEAGAVLGDLVEGFASFPNPPVAALVRSRRFGAEIAALAGAVKAGDVSGASELVFGANPITVETNQLRDLLLPTVLGTHAAARAGNADKALELAEHQRLLCAHREGPYGVGEWNRRITTWLGDAVHQHLGRWFPGQPILITANDYGLRLFNGDTGVIIQRQGRLLAAIGEVGNVREIALSRLVDVTDAYAMTIHRSQGSQFNEVTVLLPEAGSRLLTRELLYTAITRAKHRVRIVGTPESFGAGVSRHAGRASGLADRLAGLEQPRG